jgi:hypothetical protein
MRERRDPDEAVSECVRCDATVRARAGSDQADRVAGTSGAGSFLPHCARTFFFYGKRQVSYPCIKEKIE